MQPLFSEVIAKIKNNTAVGWGFVTVFLLIVTVSTLGGATITRLNNATQVASAYDSATGFWIATTTISAYNLILRVPGTPSGVTVAPNTATIFNWTTSGVKTSVGQALNTLMSGWQVDSGTYWKASTGQGGSNGWVDTGVFVPALAYAHPAIIGNKAYVIGGTISGLGASGYWWADISNPTSWNLRGTVLPADVYGGSCSGNSIDSAQLAIIGSYVYLFGGSTGAPPCGGAYDKNTTHDLIHRALTSNLDSWSNTGSKHLPGKLSESHLAIIGNSVFLFGGYNDTAYTNVIYAASTTDPTTWFNETRTLPGNVGFGQLAVIGNSVFIFGGKNAGGALNTIYAASTSNPTVWINTNRTLPSALANSQLAIIGNYVYLFGGNNTTSYINTIYRASLADPYTWSSVGTLPSTLAYSNVGVVGDYVYLLGGASATAWSQKLYYAPLTPSCVLYKTDSDGMVAATSSNNATAWSTGPLSETTVYSLSCPMADSTTRSTDPLTVTIGTPAVPAPIISITNKINSSEPATNGSFTFSVDVASTSPIVVNYTVGGVAASGVDYTALAGVATIPANQTSSAAITISPIDDTIYEGSEAVSVSVSANGNYTGTPSANITIGDDETADSVQPITISTCVGSASPACSLGIYPARTRKGSVALVTWKVQSIVSGANGNSGGGCTLTATPSLIAGIPTSSPSGVTQWESAQGISATMDRPILIRLTCSSPNGNRTISASQLLQLVPAIQEI